MLLIVKNFLIWKLSGVRISWFLSIGALGYTMEIRSIELHNRLVKVAQSSKSKSNPSLLVLLSSSLLSLRISSSSSISESPVVSRSTSMISERL